MCWLWWDASQSSFGSYAPPSVQFGFGAIEDELVIPVVWWLVFTGYAAGTTLWLKLAGATWRLLSVSHSLGLAVVLAVALHGWCAVQALHGDWL